MISQTIPGKLYQFSDSIVFCILHILPLWYLTEDLIFWWKIYLILQKWFILSELLSYFISQNTISLGVWIETVYFWHQIANNKTDTIMKTVHRAAIWGTPVPKLVNCRQNLKLVPAGGQMYVTLHEYDTEICPMSRLRNIPRIK